ncbi:MAG: DUF485 domain-containing protein [Nocardioides sp.]
MVFMAWYLLYVLLSTYAKGFMSTKVLGNINLGLILGLLQFASTFSSPGCTHDAALWTPRPSS